MDPVTPAADLVRAAQTGDHRAFTALIRESDERMRRLATRMLRSQAAMDDALQDSYLKAYRKLGTYTGEAAFSTWLYAIVYRTCLDHIRATGRRRIVAADINRVEATSPGTRDPAQQVADAATLQMELDRLPEDQVAAVLLVDGAGLSYSEAANILGVAEGTVASRLNRAHGSLRAAIDEQEGDLR